MDMRIAQPTDAAWRETAYLVLTGAGVAGRVIERGTLARLTGNRIVESYFDAAILPRPP